MTLKERHERQIEKYRDLIGIAEEVVYSARRVLQQTRKARDKDLVAEAIPELREEINYYCELRDRVIDLAHQGRAVPNAEKIYSIFETHTDLIKRGKMQTPIELAHKVFLAESTQGLNMQYEGLEGNPSDDSTGGTFFKAAQGSLWSRPGIVRFGSRLFSETNLNSCRQNGGNVVCIPQRDRKKTAKREAYEKSPARIQRAKSRRKSPRRSTRRSRRVATGRLGD